MPDLKTLSQEVFRVGKRGWLRAIANKQNPSEWNHDGGPSWGMKSRRWSVESKRCRDMESSLESDNAGAVNGGTAAEWEDHGLLEPRSKVPAFRANPILVKSADRWRAIDDTVVSRTCRT